MGSQLKDALLKAKVAAGKPEKSAGPSEPLHEAQGAVVKTRQEQGNPGQRHPARGAVAPEFSSARGAAPQRPSSAGTQRARPQRRDTRPRPVAADLQAQLRNDALVYARQPAVRPAAAADAPAVPPLKITATGPFSPNALLQVSPLSEAPRIRNRNDGISSQLTTDPEGASDLILGLDFGTSSVKAVIRDHLGNIALPVMFTQDAVHPYLLPSRVWQTGETYSLDSGETAVRDLKLALLNSGSASPVAELEDAIAFLALVIRHCRGWLFDNYGGRYGKDMLTWRINLGLPARSYEDEKHVRLFRRLAWAAGNCAADPSPVITRELVGRYRSLSKAVIEGVPENPDAEFTLKDVDVVPEIAAQVFGFVESSRWNWRDNPMMIMVDVGAGTVDAAFFSVVQNNRTLRFSFFANEVEQNGAMNLHRARIGWLRGIFNRGGVVDPALASFLDETEKPTDKLGRLPESVMDYAGGYRIEIPANESNGDDLFIKDKYRPQVFRCIRGARRQGVPDVQLQQLPMFICGGGARMEVFHCILEQINSAPVNVTLVEHRLPKPEELIAENLPASEFDRLSVAYGLSRQGAGGKPLGEYIRSVDIPPVLPPQPVDYQQYYIEQP